MTRGRQRQGKVKLRSNRHQMEAVGRTHHGDETQSVSATRLEHAAPRDDIANSDHDRHFDSGSKC